MRRHISYYLFGIALAAGCSGSDAPKSTELGLGYDDSASLLLVTVTRDLKEGETLHARVRRGRPGTLDCGSAAATIDRVDPFRVSAAQMPTFVGPSVKNEDFVSPYDSSWLSGAGPTPEMLARVAEGAPLVDVCLMKGVEVVKQAEIDLKTARDRAGANGKFDGDENERIASTQAYAERCVEDLGEIPFFEKIDDKDYTTYNCLDSVPIPTTVTNNDGTVEKPAATVGVCDQPQYIYSLCEGNAVSGRSNGPRVARRDNDRGTSWVLLCRKAKEQEGEYNDIAMIGHNPFTGKTCFFQNALYSRTDGLHVPHPGDKKHSQQSPQKSEALWEGIHGGLGSGIQCAKCHDADPFIHTPWIDQARMPDGTAVVPKMGEHENFALGFNDAPYTIINTEGQGWTMPQVVTATEASACTRCHRMGNGEWMESWLRRLNGTDSAWSSIVTEKYRAFEHAFWMPPDADGLDATTFANSEYGKSMQHIMDCDGNPSACRLQALPSRPIVDEGELPGIDLEGNALAKSALAILGADIADASCPNGDCSNRRCAECHSVSRNGLRRWLSYTQSAWNTCNLKADPSTLSQSDAKKAVDCLRVEPSDGNSVFEAVKLGVLTTGVQYGHFQKLFRKAYGDSRWLVEYNKFKARVGMPKGSHPRFSQKEYATLFKWFDQSLPKLDEELREAPAPSSCMDALDSSGIKAHVDDMKFEGWSAVNKENGLRMHGCSTENPLECFGDKSEKPEWLEEGAGKLRQVNAFNFRTSFWTRASADGRFVGNGGGNGSGATITDLQTGTDIKVRASYDPGFFPDNSGFIFQGATGGAGICRQSLLEHDTSVEFDEPECMSASGINLYQHVARGLGASGDYFIINSQFTSDAGGGGSDPSASFNASSTMKFTPMVFNGSKYEQMPNVIVDSPYEGDSVLSPSMRLVASRLSGADGKSLGYVIRKVAASRFGTSYRIGIDQKLATVCFSGAKPNFSFDERFFVTHHYDNNSSNIILTDLVTGTRKTITKMPSGLRALFPHFRSDGWFYFLVKGSDKEYLMASDAALRASTP